jgi:hypothetical protein
VPLLYALAIWLARGYRRRTLMNVGIAIVFAGVLVFLARTLIVSQVTDSLVKTDSVSSCDRSVPARPARLDVRDRRGDHGADLHLAADPRDRHAGRDHRVPRLAFLGTVLLRRQTAEEFPDA